jgi:NADH dehydrogenase
MGLAATRLITMDPSAYVNIPETRSPREASTHRVLIVGGGAGGLELATRLGDTVGKRNRASIALLDKARTHIWKPHLHEVAAGTLDTDVQSVEYLPHAHRHHYRYRVGAMCGLNRDKRQVYVDSTFDEDGLQVTPARVLGYDTLVMAVGSVGNDFGTPGAKEHAIAIDTHDQAARFNRRMLNACARANAQHEPLRPGQLHCAIVGAGATGVELSAELHKTMRDIAAYGLDNIDFDKLIRLTIIEAGPRVLPALPDPLAHATLKTLQGLGIGVRTGERVTAITPEGLQMASGEFLPAELIVWAAGIKAPDFLADLDGLESDRLGRLVVRDTLQSTRDDNIFAIGDCASYALPGGKGVAPPRAQTAHQMASLLIRSVNHRLRGLPLPKFNYRDFGSLVNMSEYGTVGNLMDGMTGRSVKVQGFFARTMYRSLYTMHQQAIHGTAKVGIDMVANAIRGRMEPRIKLH